VSRLWTIGIILEHVRKILEIRLAPAMVVTRNLPLSFTHVVPTLMSVLLQVD
jgi:hypothetical protein